MKKELVTYNSKKMIWETIHLLQSIPSFNLGKSILAYTLYLSFNSNVKFGSAHPLFPAHLAI
ncbi:hypothetical protein ABRY23_11190 [Melioribacteraceae bacterium 4301-Me]|uniref:hypothetical protein n=1 Tax=Pyranulibacter aquaticus TaxID=3163344 RepID=UPI003594E398